MRVTTAFNRLLDLPGASVTDVDIGADAVVVTVRLRRRRLNCADCGHSTRARYDERPVESRWRHLDLGRHRLEIRARLRRLVCPAHGVRTEAVPFARAGSGFTGDFEALVAWLAVRMDKTAICDLVRINWRTVGRIIERVVADALDPGRLDGLFEIGVDEISWRKHHNYLTLVADHRSGKVVWGAEGRDSGTLDGFFDELGTERSAQLGAGVDGHGARVRQVRASTRGTGHDLSGPVPRRGPGHQGPRRGPPAAVATDAPAARPCDRPQVQRCPVGAVEEPRQPHRHPGRHPRPGPPKRRRHVAGLPAERSPSGGLRR